MENFLLLEEKLENTKDKPKLGLEDNIDMFQDLPSENKVKNKDDYNILFKIYAF